MGLRESIAGVTPFAEISRRPTTIVYKGYDPKQDRFVLLKVLRPEFAAQPDVLERFRNEARLLARVTHPNVVVVHAHGVEQNTAYLITEYVEGRTLSDVVEDSRLSPYEAAKMTLSIARGLGAAHRAGVLHRDLKPDNVLVSEEEEIKITDFGLAVTSDGLAEASPRIAGTLRYLAPEVLQGQPPSQRSDLFSCGATFFEMLTGQPAFSDEDDGRMIDAVLHRNPMRDIEQFSTAPAGLIVICGRLLRKNPDDRLASCDELEEQLTRWMAAHGADSAGPEAETATGRLAPKRADDTALQPARTQTPDKRPTSRRHIVRWAVAATVALVAVPTLVLMMMRTPATPDSEGILTSESIAPVPKESNDTLTQVSGEVSLAQTSTDPIVELSSGTRNPEQGRRPRNVTPTVIDGKSQNTVLPPSTDEPAADMADVDASANLEQAAAGFLSVRSVPWAEVWINGERRTTTNGDSIELPPGAYELVLRNPEFPDYSQPITMEPGERKTLDVSLWATVARLNITVIPWAEVVVDGIVLDTIPPQKRPIILQPGTHRLTLRHPELGQIERDVLLRAGEERTLAYNLREASER